MLPQPFFLPYAEILYLIPSVAITYYCRYGHGDYFVQLMPHLRLLPSICYTAEAFLHHTDHLGVLFYITLYNSFW